MEFANEVSREVNDCLMQHAVRKSSKNPFGYSKLAAVVVRFKVIGEPSYPQQTFEFSYADMNPEPYETLTEELVETRPDLVALGWTMKPVREEQTAHFAQIGFTKRPKAIRSLVATILIHCRIRKAPASLQALADEEEKKE